MKEPIVIGIAGGSGSGKSTLCVSLCEKYPDIFSLIHLDDYFVTKDEAPKLHGFTNWDCPEALRFDDLYYDILDLKEGRSITVRTKSELYNSEYTRNKDNRIDITIHPAKVILVEGYLILSNERIRSTFEHEIFLNISIEESLKRRSSNKFTPDSEYIEKVLYPMHRKYVEPTKKYADWVIDAENLNSSAVQAFVESHLKGSDVL